MLPSQMAGSAFAFAPSAAIDSASLRIKLGCLSKNTLRTDYTKGLCSCGILGVKYIEVCTLYTPTYCNQIPSFYTSTQWNKP